MAKKKPTPRVGKKPRKRLGTLAGDHINRRGGYKALKKGLHHGK